MDRKKFKELTFKQKIQWLIQYYGVVALVAILAVIVIVSMIKAFLFPAPVSDVCVLFLTDTMGQNEAYELQDIIEEKTQKTASVTAYLTTDTYGRQAFSAKVNADLIDIVIAPGVEKDAMLEGGYLVTCEPFADYDDLYVGTTVKTREGKLPSDTIDIITDYFKNRN